MSEIGVESIEKGRREDTRTGEWKDGRTDDVDGGKLAEAPEEDEVGGNPTPSRSVGNVRAPLPVPPSLFLPSPPQLTDSPSRRLIRESTGVLVETNLLFLRRTSLGDVTVRSVYLM